MLYLPQNQPTRLNTTFWENSTNLVNPYFTWRIINKQSLVETIFYANDFSQVPWYYNSFTVSASTTTIGLTAGIINSAPGEYTYTVYQMSNPYDLDLANAIKEVETGILVISATYTPQESFTASSGTIGVWTNMDRI